MSSDLSPKLACADFSFPLLSHDHSLDLIARLGMGGVDIGLFPDRSHFQPRDYEGKVAVAARELSARVRDRGLEFADIFLQPSSSLDEMAPNHPDASERERWRKRFAEGLELTVLCEATHMTSLPGIQFDGESVEDSMGRSSDELAQCVEQAREAGVVFSVEPHMWSMATTTELASRLVEMTDGLTLTLDYGHYIVQGEENAAIEPLVKYASHFHARSASKGFLQTSLANNSINFAGAVKAMKACSYQGWLGVEYVRMTEDVVPDVDNLSETILMRDHLRDAWG